MDCGCGLWIVYAIYLYKYVKIVRLYLTLSKSSYNNQRSFNNFDNIVDNIIRALKKKEVSTEESVIHFSVQLKHNNIVLTL